MKTALSIAGSDSCGGAGIQADIKTMTLNGVYAMSAVTALTAQNTTGVSAILEADADFLEKEINAVFEDIFPDAVKIGMVSSSALIEVIAQRLKFYQAENIVVDPVMVATSGARLINDSAINTLETEVLSGMKISDKDDMEKAAVSIGEKFKCAVLVKGGHSINDADDILYSNGKITYFKGKRIDNPNTHGTGCTLSSAIAANLAKGYSLEKSVERAKEYISGALGAMLDLGRGSGPMNHAFDLKGKFAE